MIWTYPVDGYTYVIMATTILSQVVGVSPPKYPTSLHHRHKPENLDFGWIYTLMLFYNKFWPYHLNVKVENETTKHFSGLQLSILADPLLPQFPVLSWQWSHLLQSFAASRVHILYWVVATCLGGEIAVEQVYLIKRPVSGVWFVMPPVSAFFWKCAAVQKFSAILLPMVKIIKKQPFNALNYYGLFKFLIQSKKRNSILWLHRIRIIVAVQINGNNSS